MVIHPDSRERTELQRVVQRGQVMHVMQRLIDVFRMYFELNTWTVSLAQEDILAQAFLAQEDIGCEDTDGV